MVYEMVVGEVQEANGSWHVSFAPDNNTWITVWPEQVGGVAPQVGDFLTVRAPEVVGIERRGLRLVKEA